jgi:hypothetical protein
MAIPVAIALFFEKYKPTATIEEMKNKHIPVPEI